MPRFYSPSNNAFYSEALHGARQIAAEQSEKDKKAGKRPAMIDNPACTMPADAVPVTEQRFETLLAAQGEGKEIVEVRGKPVARDFTPDAEELLASRRRQRDRLLAASDWTQLPDSPLASGWRDAWATYRYALRNLDMTGTDWPAAPGGED